MTQIWCFCSGSLAHWVVTIFILEFILDCSGNVAHFSSSSIDVTISLLFQLQLSQSLTAKQLKRLQSCELGAGQPLHQRLQVSIFTVPNIIWYKMKGCVVEAGGASRCDSAGETLSVFVMHVYPAHVRPAAANSRLKQRPRRSSSRP